MQEPDPKDLEEWMEELVYHPGFIYLCSRFVPQADSAKPFIGITDLQTLGQFQGRSKAILEVLGAPKQILKELRGKV